LSADAVERLLKKHLTTASEVCASLKKKPSPSIACATRRQWTCCMPASSNPSSRYGWGTGPLKPTQVYLDADLALKEKILARTIPFDSKPGKFPPTTGC
jgi:hypothetical protein